MSFYPLNTPYPNKVLHVVSADSSSVTKVANLWDANGVVTSNASVDFDVQKYLGEAIQSPRKNIHVVSTVTAARFPFTFYTTDNRNNNVWLYWNTFNETNNQSVAKGNAVLLRSKQQVDTIIQDGAILPSSDDGLTNGTYEWNEFMEMLNEIFASYAGTGTTATSRARYPLYWLQYYRFIYSQDQLDNAEFPLTTADAVDPPHNDIVRLFDTARNTYYTPLVERGDGSAPSDDDRVVKLWFTFTDPNGVLSDRAAVQQFGARKEEDLPIVPYRNGGTLTVENRLVGKMPMSMLGGRFEQLYVRVNFLAHQSSQTNVLQTIPVESYRFDEIVFHGGANATPRLLQLQNPQINSIRFDITDRDNNLMNFRGGNWTMTIRFDFVKQPTPELETKFSPMKQLAQARVRKQQLDRQRARMALDDNNGIEGVDQNPADMDEEAEIVDAVHVRRSHLVE